MASSQSLFICFSILCLLLKSTICTTDSSVACSKEKLIGYTYCLPLPIYNSTLSYSYDRSNSSLSILFIAAPPTLDGWIGWGINPTGEGMIGGEVIVGFKHNKVMVVKTMYLKSYFETVYQKLSFEVWGMKVEQEEGGFMKIYATVKLPHNTEVVKYIWQVGPSITDDGMLVIHSTDPHNLQTKGNLSLVGIGVCRNNSTYTSDKMLHEIYTLVGFGILLPIGIIMPRYLNFYSINSIPWFCVYACILLLGFSVGFAGWVHGVAIGRKSVEHLFSSHGVFGTIVLVLAAIRTIILFKLTNNDHRHPYSNLYHYTLGCLTIFLATYNITLGIERRRLERMNYEQSWESLYGIWVTILCGVVLGEFFVRARGLCSRNRTGSDRPIQP